MLFVEYLELKWRTIMTTLNSMLVLRHLWVILHGIQPRFSKKVLSINLILFHLELVNICSFDFNRIELVTIFYSFFFLFFFKNAFKVARSYRKIFWCKIISKTVIEHMLIVIRMSFVLCKSHEVNLSDYECF